MLPIFQESSSEGCSLFMRNKNGGNTQLWIFFLASVQKSQNPVQNYNHIVKNGKETKRNISFHSIFDVLQEHFGVCSSFGISSYLSNKSLFCSKCLVHTFLWLLLLADKSIWNDIEHYLCAASNLTTESLIGCSYHHQGTWAILVKVGSISVLSTIFYTVDQQVVKQLLPLLFFFPSYDLELPGD